MQQSNTDPSAIQLMQSSADPSWLSQVGSDLKANGYARVLPEALDWSELEDQYRLQRAFDFDQEADATGGQRWRSHSKVQLHNNVLIPQPHSHYIQSADYNPDHGGMRRQLQPIADSVVKSATIAYLVQTTRDAAMESMPNLFERSDVAVGLHMVSYRPSVGSPAYSSPIWLHRDEEEFVAVVLCGLTHNLGGGDNLITLPGSAAIRDVFKMKDRLEILLLTKKCLHAVTPMYSMDGRPARRDILIITLC